MTEPAENPFAPLGTAFDQAAGALRHPDTFSEERAFRIVTQLDDALRPAETFRGLVLALLEHAGGGRAQVATEIGNLDDQLASYSALLTERRAKIEERNVKRVELRERAEEAQGLMKENAELERMDKLADQLPVLRERRAQWEAQSKTLNSDLDDEEKLAAVAAASVTVQLEPLLERLREKTRVTVSRMEELRTKITEHDAELRKSDAEIESLQQNLVARKQMRNAVSDRLKSIQAEIGEQTAEYRSHADQERRVLAALSRLRPPGSSDHDDGQPPDPRELARQALDEIARRIDEIDAQVSVAIADAEAEEKILREPRRLTDEPGPVAT